MNQPVRSTQARTLSSRATITILATLPSVFVATLVTGCGGSSPAGSGAPPPPPPGQRLHAFLENSGSGGNLTLFSPSDPATTFPVTAIPSLGSDYNPVVRGTLDITGGVIRDIEVDALVFGVGSNVIEVPLAGAAALQAPRTVTILSSIISNIEVTVDLGAASRTLVYTARLVTGDYVAFEDVAGTPSIQRPFPGVPITPTVERTTGAMNGWLALESNMLTRVTRNLVTTNLAPVTTAEYIDINADGDTFLFLGNRFGSFRQNGTLATFANGIAAATFFAPEDFAVVGAEAMFFPAATSGASFGLWRATGDGSAGPITGDFMGTPTFVQVTPSRVIVGYADQVNGGTSLVSLDHLGNDLVLLEIGALNLDITRFKFPGISSNRIAYEVEGEGVIDVQDDGQDRQVHAGARLAGVSISGDLTVHSSSEIDALFLTTTRPAGNLRLEAVTPGNPNTLRSLGSLPLGVDTVSVTAFYSDSALVTGTFNAGANFQSDIWVAQTSQGNSLVRVTDSALEFDLGLL